MNETLEILSDPSLVEDIFKSKSEESFAVVLTAEQLRERIIFCEECGTMSGID